MLVIACDAPQAPAVAPPSPTDAPVRGGTLVIGSSGDVVTLQPILSVDDGSASSLRFIYWPLLERESGSGALKPGLAQRFDATPDGKTITFTLRPGIVWSDGVPITGDDYRYYVEATARSKKTVWKSKFQDIVGWSDYAQGRDETLRGIRVANGGSVIEVNLTRSTCLSFENLNIAPIPRHRFVTQWDNKSLDVSTSIDKAGFNLSPPVASGPFMFKELRPSEQLVVTRNDRFFKGAPLLEEVIFKTYATPGGTRTAFVTGETHMFTPQPQDVDYVRQQMGPTIREYRQSDKLEYQFIAWNQKATRALWLADKRVRQALWYGLDVGTIVDKVLSGWGHRVFANTPQASWAYDGTGLNHYDYDPTRARSLLEAAGATMGSDGIYRWTNGQPMEIRIETNTGNPIRASVLQIAVEQYKAIGIRIIPVTEAFATLAGRVTPSDGSVEGVLLGWSFNPDPSADAYPIWHSSMQGADGYNFVGMNDRTLDAALDAARFGPDCGADARRSALHTADLVLNENAPYVFLFAQDSVFFVNNKLVRPAPQPFGSWIDIEKWWLRP